MKKTITLGIFPMLIFMGSGILGVQSAGAESSSALPEVKTSPVSSEQARRSDDLGQSSTALVTKVETYNQSVHAIREVRTGSQKRIEQAVEQEKVREAWETGKLIDEHILLHKERAEYEKEVIARLVKDLETSDTELYRMLEFA